MPDIAMCKGEGCTNKETCYRAQAEPSSHRQAYFAVEPLHPDGSCDFYWPIRKPNAQP